MRTAIRRLAGFAACAALAALVPACETGGNFTLLGYTTRPNYDQNIRTIRVPIFQNRTLIRGIEFDLTQAVIREIEQKTPFKVVGPGCNADTELSGTIVTYTKGLLNVNQLNEVREAETTLAVEVVWRDLRTGEYLTKPIRRPGEAPLPVLQPPRGLAVGMLSGPAAPTAPQPPSGPSEPLPNVGEVPPLLGAQAPPPVIGVPIAPELAKPPSVVIRSMASFIPELGESRTTALQKNVNSLAVQIISMMETPW